MQPRAQIDTYKAAPDVLRAVLATIDLATFTTSDTLQRAQLSCDRMVSVYHYRLQIFLTNVAGVQECIGVYESEAWDYRFLVVIFTMCAPEEGRACWLCMSTMFCTI